MKRTPKEKDKILNDFIIMLKEEVEDVNGKMFTQDPMQDPEHRLKTEKTFCAEIHKLTLLSKLVDVQKIIVTLGRFTAFQKTELTAVLKAEIPVFLANQKEPTSDKQFIERVNFKFFNNTAEMFEKELEAHMRAKTKTKKK